MNGMMNGSYAAAPAPSPSSLFQHCRRHHHGGMMMHMTFFWGTETEVLFDNWPGKSLTMYWICLATVFVMAAITEWLPRLGVMKSGKASFGAGLVQTLVYIVKVGLAYLAMLAAMSFNGGVFLATVAGFGFGFLIFASRAFRDTTNLLNEPLVQSHC